MKTMYMGPAIPMAKVQSRKTGRAKLPFLNGSRADEKQFVFLPRGRFVAETARG